MIFVYEKKEFAIYEGLVGNKPSMSDWVNILSLPFKMSKLGLVAVAGKFRSACL